MSHFTVLVIGENAEAQLAPYQENNMGDCPKEYLAFQDCDAEARAEWEKYAEGRTLEAYAKANGYKLHEGKYGYWKNPNKKWDWYQLGGRWTGYFKLKAGARGKVGEPGVMTPASTDARRADSARVSDIDFAGMRDEAGERAGNRYDQVLELCGGAIPKLDFTWKSMFDKDSPHSLLDHQARRETFWAQPGAKRWQEAQQKAPKESEFIWADIEDYQCTREEFIQRARDAAAVTFAVLKDGKWYERGSMGWWGCVSDEKDTAAWHAEIAKLIDGLPPDTLLSVYDCHI